MAASNVTWRESPAACFPITKNCWYASKGYGQITVWPRPGEKAGRTLLRE